MNSNRSHYILPEPYPTLEGIRPDPAVARSLLAAYASAASELSAVTQYFYNSLLASAAGIADLGDLFSCVSCVEMHHMQLLGELILAYGGDPGFMSYGRGGRTQWWSGAFLSYDKAPALMLRRAIEGERSAIADYHRIQELMRDKCARVLLNRIIADEEHHIVLFTEALAGVPEPIAPSQNYTKRRAR